LVQLVWLIPSLAMGLYFGLANGMWQFALMAGLSALIVLGLKFRRRTDDNFTLEIRTRGVFVNGRRVSYQIRFWPKSWREEFARQFANLLAELPQPLVKTRFEPLSFVAGFGCELNLANDGPHLFLVGPTGAGKSKFLELLLSTLSGEPELRLADFKGGASLSRFGNCVTDLSMPAEREDFWRGLGELLHGRESYLALHGVSRASDTSLNSVVVVVDELAHALREDRSALAALSAVAARGRSLGVHLICASQSVSGVPRELLVNLNLRVVLAGTDEVDALQLGAKGRPVRVNGLGVGQVVGGSEFRFPFRQVPLRESLPASNEQQPPAR
jgi:energy-coupling factor transporter ATP-binding protein EcfA2